VHASDIGIGADDVSWTLNDRVPLFVRLPAGAGPELRGSRSVAAGQTDLAPTLLALLGIDPSPFPYVGRNLLTGIDAPVVRPYGDWLDGHHLFLARGATNVCYDLSRRAAAGAADCAEADRSARRARQVSRFVVLEDLQQRLFEKLQSR
jgi:hypothetical protein